MNKKDLAVLNIFKSSPLSFRRESLDDSSGSNNNNNNTNANDRTIREGWLSRRMGFFSNWKKVYATLASNGVLQVWPTQRDYHKRRKLLLQILVPETQIKLAQQIIGMANSFGFFFSTKKEPHFFAAESDHELIDWIGALKFYSPSSKFEFTTDQAWDVYFVDAVVVGSASGIIIGLNEAAVRLLKYNSKSDLLGQNVSIIMPPHLRKVHEGWMSKYIETGQRKLIGKPRVVTAFTATGESLRVKILLSEEVTEGKVKYIAILKPVKEDEIEEEFSSTEVEDVETLSQTSDHSEDSVLGQQISHEDTKEMLTLFNTLSDSEKNQLLVRYVEVSRHRQAQAEFLLKQFIMEDHHLFFKFKSELVTDKRATQRRGSAGDPYEIMNMAYSISHKQFWNVKTDEIDFLNNPSSSTASSLTDVYKSFVPNLILRRMSQSLQKLDLPELETFVGAVMFCDISGFTNLTEKMSRFGFEGIEKLSSELNKYFDRLISIISDHGGDIIKFAGDALLVVWPGIGHDSISGNVLLACQCAQRMISNLNNYTVSGLNFVSTLQLHIGIGAGGIGAVTVGAAGRCEFFLGGQVLDQVSECEKQAKPGEICVSPYAWILAQKGRLAGYQRSKSGTGSNYYLEDVLHPASLPGPIQFLVPESHLNSLRQFVPKIISKHFEDPKSCTKFLAELREVTVIFVNLALAFREDKISVFQAVTEIMFSITRGKEGIIRQFLIDDKGCVFIAGFGLPPLSHLDDPYRGVTTALEIHQRLSEMNISCSIGITTGRAFCGCVGSSKRREYAMVGDVVNLSARLMGKAQLGVMVDQNTRDACQNTIEFGRLQKIVVKGKSDPISVYRPMQLRRASSTTASDSEGLGPVLDSSELVGRKQEVETIQQICKNYLGSIPELASHESSLIMVRGEGGVGKSALINFAKQLFVEKNQFVFETSASCDETANAYHVWGPLIATLFDEEGYPKVFKTINLNNNNNQNQQTCQHVHDDLTKCLLENKNYLPLLSPLLHNHKKKSDQMDHLPDKKRSEILFHLVLRLAEELLQPGSLLVIKSAHWMDSLSKDILEQFLIRKRGVLVIMSMLQTESLSFTSFRQIKLCHIIELKPLTEDETIGYIASLLHAKTVSPELGKLIYEKCQGNPFLTQEIVSQLQSGNTLRIERDHVSSVADPQSCLQSVPSSIRGMLTSKIDSLSLSEKQIIQHAAIIGDKFNFEVLNAMIPELKESDLEGLAKRGFIRASEFESEMWYFQNSLVKDTVYNMMLFTDRRSVHKAVGDYLLKNHSEQVSYPMIAHHFKFANDERAVNFLYLCGQNALKNCANKEAVVLFRDAMETADKTECHETELLQSCRVALALAFFKLEQYTESVQYLKTALKNFGVQLPLKKSTHNKAKALLSKLPSLSKSPTLAANASPKTSPTPTAKLTCLALTALQLLAQSAYYLGNISLAVFAVSLASQAIDRTQDFNIQYSVVIAKLLALKPILMCENPAPTEKHFEKQMQQSIQESSQQLKSLEKPLPKVDYNALQAYCNFYYSRLSFHCGDFKACLKTAEIGATLYDSLGEHRFGAECLILMALCLAFQNNLEKLNSEKWIQDMSLLEQERYSSQGDSSVHFVSKMIRSYVHLCSGEIELASQLVKEGQALVEKNPRMDGPRVQGMIRGVMALCKLLEHFPGEGFQNAAKAVHLSMELNSTMQFSIEYVMVFDLTCQTLLKLLCEEHSLSEKEVSKSKLTKEADRAIQTFQSYCKVHHFADPLASMYKTVFSCCLIKQWSTKVDTAFETSKKSLVQKGFLFHAQTLLPLFETALRRKVQKVDPKAKEK